MQVNPPAVREPSDLWEAFHLRDLGSESCFGS